MSQIGKDLLQDCSTQSEFCFSLRCAECGEVWKSRAIRFSRAGVTPPSEGKRVIFDTLYKREKDEALLRAAEEVGKAFNHCPICHRMVCDHCFLVCDELDMCVACARHLQEHGELVAECTEGGTG
ncbi:hypothetical protein SAMN05216343_12713 [Oscillibacter sp. PC13]|uniref:hypothetical protein n=1 Tax=Oscillibacter sp. PC13 TaxID=1855299 RepID=UPI0008EEFD06|nr:hypothetical protein [Oscillibacter sp. PC13]SFQ15495.1 hypothetical protein SAMN05216343_12713 [Oscillibacter sp. PC13]